MQESAIARVVANYPHEGNLRKHRCGDRRSDPGAAFDVELWLGGVSGGQDAGEHVLGEPGDAARGGGESEDDGVVGDAGGGVGGVPAEPAASGDGNGAVSV